MTGVYQHSLDAKGRLFIPASLRETLGQSFFVTVSPEQCLSGYPMEKWNRLKEKYEAMSYKDRKKIRSVFSHAAKCDLDAQGRILLPMQLREFAGLKKNVAVVGVGVNIEIWDAEKKYNPEFIGYAWDDKNPRIQLEPRGERGYIELVPVKKI